MSLKTVYTIMSIFWISAIILYIYMGINHFKTKNKLGEKLVQNPISYNFYMLNSGLFLIIAIQRLIHYANSKELYSLLLAIAFFTLLPLTLIKALTRPAIHENGFINQETILFWKKTKNYTLLQSKSEDNNPLLYKLAFTSQRNKKYNFAIDQNEIEKVVALLNSKGVERI